MQALEQFTAEVRALREAHRPWRSLASVTCDVRASAANGQARVHIKDASGGASRAGLLLQPVHRCKRARRVALRLGGYPHAGCLQSDADAFNAEAVCIHSIVMTHLPLDLTGGTCPTVALYKGRQSIFSTAATPDSVIEWHADSGSLTVSMAKVMKGEGTLLCYVGKDVLTGRVLFRFPFHTALLVPGCLTLNKSKVRPAMWRARHAERAGHALTLSKWTRGVRNLQLDLPVPHPAFESEQFAVEVVIKHADQGTPDSFDVMAGADVVTDLTGVMAMHQGSHMPAPTNRPGSCSRALLRPAGMREISRRFALEPDNLLYKTLITSGMDEVAACFALQLAGNDLDRARAVLSSGSLPTTKEANTAGVELAKWRIDRDLAKITRVARDSPPTRPPSAPPAGEAGGSPDAAVRGRDGLDRIPAAAVPTAASTATAVVTATAAVTAAAAAAAGDADADADVGVDVDHASDDDVGNGARTAAAATADGQRPPKDRAALPSYTWMPEDLRRDLQAASSTIRFQGAHAGEPAVAATDASASPRPAFRTASDLSHSHLAPFPPGATHRRASSATDVAPSAFEMLPEGLQQLGRPRRPSRSTRSMRSAEAMSPVPRRAVKGSGDSSLSVAAVRGLLFAETPAAGHAVAATPEAAQAAQAAAALYASDIHDGCQEEDDMLMLDFDGVEDSFDVDETLAALSDFGAPIESGTLDSVFLDSDLSQLLAQFKGDGDQAGQPAVQHTNGAAPLPFESRHPLPVASHHMLPVRDHPVFRIFLALSSSGGLPEQRLTQLMQAHGVDASTVQGDPHAVVPVSDGDFTAAAALLHSLRMDEAQLAPLLDRLEGVPAATRTIASTASAGAAGTAVDIVDGMAEVSGRRYRLVLVDDAQSSAGPPVASSAAAPAMHTPAPIAAASEGGAAAATSAPAPPTAAVAAAAAAQAMAPTPADAAATASTGAGGSAEAGDSHVDPALEPYLRMLKMGVPMGAVKQKMLAAGADPTAMEAAARARGLDAYKPPEPPKAEEQQRDAGSGPPLREHPDFALYFKMLKNGVPMPAVQHKMTVDGKDPAVLSMDPDKPLPVAPKLRDDARFAAYFKMLKMGVPKPAAQQKMVKDGLNPDVLEQDPGKPLPASVPVLLSQRKPAPGAGRGTTGQRVVRKKLHWEAIPEERLADAHTIWHAVREGGGDDFLSDVGLELFVKDASNDSRQRVASAAPGTASEPAKKKRVTLLEHKRATNVGIGLARIRMTPAELRHALETLDSSVPLDDQQLTALEEMLPTPEEVVLVRNYPGPASDLSEAEQFFLEVSHVARAKARLHCLLYRTVLPSRLLDLRERITTVRRACEQVRDSRLFKKLLQVVLMLGNRLNAGEVRAFTLNSLLALGQTKSFDQKTTVLAFVEDVLDQKLPEVKDFAAELSESAAASRLHLDALVAEEAELARGYERLLQEIEQTLPDVAQHARTMLQSRERLPSESTPGETASPRAAPARAPPTGGMSAVAAAAAAAAAKRHAAAAPVTSSVAPSPLGGSASRGASDAHQTPSDKRGRGAHSDAPEPATLEEMTELLGRQRSPAEFLVEARTQLRRLHLLTTEVKRQFSLLVKYFGENPNCNSEEFFTTLAEFCQVRGGVHTHLARLNN